jgi:cell division protein FtsN
MAKKQATGQPGSDGKKKFSLKLTRTGVAVWLCVIFCVCSWMFALGVMVGRETVPIRFDVQDIQKKLAALKIADLKAKLKRFKIDRKSLEEKPDLPFHEKLREPEKHPPLPPVATPEAQRRTKAKRPVVVNTPKKQPTPAPAVQQKKQVAGPTKTSGKQLTVQVASVKVSKDAERLVASLKKKGYPAYKALGKVPGKGIWYRVRVGPYPTADKANAVLNRLKKEKLKGIVLTY